MRSPSLVVSSIVARRLDTARGLPIFHRRSIRWGCLALACLVLAVAGYFFGESTGSDLGAARAAGSAAGRVKGAEIGSRLGYARGYRHARQFAYKRTYPRAYRDAYRAAFNDAGLATPSATEIEVP